MIGRRVRTCVHHNNDDGYTSYARHMRGKYAGQIGRVVDFSNSHGLCFEVRFTISDSAWFDLGELEEINE